MIRFTIHPCGPLPEALLTTLRQIPEVEVESQSVLEESYTDLEAMSAEEEERAFREATLRNNRRFWTANADLLQ